MKILYHHRTAAGDGQRVHITEMVAAFERAGHEVIMVGPTIAAASSYQASGGIVSWIREKLPAFVGELLELAYSLRAYMKLLSAIKQHKPDMLYERANLFLLAGVWAARSAKTPLLLEVNAPLTEERGRHGTLHLKGLARWSEEKTWQSADYVLPVSQVLADKIYAGGVPAEKVHVIHNGIRLEQYERRDKGKKEKTTLGFIGFVRDWHGLDQIIEMMVEPDFETVTLEIAGDGPALNGLKQQTEQLGLSDRVLFKGMIARNEVPDLLANWDIALQPGVTPYASPLKLFEYMAAATAILAPDQPNIREVLKDGENALLFSNQPNAQVDALRRLVKDADLRHSLGRAARKTIEDKPYTWDGNAARVISLVKALSD